MTDSLSIALSGLTAQKQKLAATASNIANVSTSGAVPSSAPSAAATVYRPLRVDFTSLEGGGVSANVTPDENGYSVVYDPSSAQADDAGYIAVPNIDLAEEAVNIMVIKSEFKANLSVIKAQNEMTDELLDILA